LLGSLSLLGLAASSERQLQIKVTGNIEQEARTERAAEWALAWAEDWLFSLEGDARPTLCTAQCKPGEFILDEASFPAAPERADADWWHLHGVAPGRQPASGEILESLLANLPAISVIGEIPVPAEYTEGLETRPGYYRVMARAEDSNTRQVVVVESIVARPWGETAWADPLPVNPARPGFCQRLGLEPCGRLAWRRLR
jgi:Tfp pilus assembly protein PilX